MKKQMPLGLKVGLGFTVVTLILAGTVLTTIVQVRQMADTTNRIADLRVPTSQASLMLLNGMNHSLAALRGWIILGKDGFRAERNRAWSDEIEPSLAFMKEVSVNWTDPQNVERLRIIETKLADFKRYQREIEDIAQTIDNTPALKILFEEAAPKAGILTSRITEMIDVEAGLAATSRRKALLGMMADVRGTTGLALANIRAYLLSGDEKFVAKFDKLWAKNIRRFGDLSAQAKLLSPKQQVAFEAFSEARADFAPLPHKMFKIRGSSEWNLANTWLGTKAAPTGKAIVEQVNAMMLSQRRLLAADTADSKDRAEFLTDVEWVLLGVGLVSCIVCGLMITRSIEKSTTGPIKRIIVGLSEAAEQVTSSSGQVSSSSQALAEGASEQAAGVEETSAALEEMAAMTKQNADSAEEANGVMGEAKQLVDRGQESMGRLSSAIEEIKDSADQTAKIVKTIDEIASQTNLLALNAAVEAARAGDAGKGFAVVAEEVRNLAGRASEAARDTAGLIEGSVKNAERGVAVATETAEALTSLSTASEQVLELVSAIATASREQEKGIDQVSVAVSQMDGVTQQNAASAEESASASEELTSQANEMHGLVSDLAATVGGTRATTRPTITPANTAPASSSSDSWMSRNRKAAGVSAEPLKSPLKTVEAEATSDPAPAASPSQVIPLDEDEMASF